MKIDLDLDSINLEDVVQQAVISILTKSLGKTLPDVVDKLLTEKEQYGKTNMLKRAFEAAVNTEITKHVDEFIDTKSDAIRQQVRDELEKQLDPSSVAATITEQLAMLKVSIRPFGKKVGKVMSSVSEEDE